MNRCDLDGRYWLLWLWQKERERETCMNTVCVLPPRLDVDACSFFSFWWFFLVLCCCSASVTAPDSSAPVVTTPSVVTARRFLHELIVQLEDPSSSSSSLSFLQGGRNHAQEWHAMLADGKIPWINASTTTTTTTGTSSTATSADVVVVPEKDHDHNTNKDDNDNHDDPMVGVNKSNESTPAASETMEPAPPSVSPTAMNARLIVLATHVLQRLLHHHAQAARTTMTTKSAAASNRTTTASSAAATATTTTTTTTTTVPPWTSDKDRPSSKSMHYMYRLAWSLAQALTELPPLPSSSNGNGHSNQKKRKARSKTPTDEEDDHDKDGTAEMNENAPTEPDDTAKTKDQPPSRIIKLDKIPSGPVRQIVGRAMLVITMVAAQPSSSRSGGMREEDQEEDGATRLPEPPEYRFNDCVAATGALNRILQWQVPRVASSTVLANRAGATAADGAAAATTTSTTTLNASAEAVAEETNPPATAATTTTTTTTTTTEQQGASSCPATCLSWESASLSTLLTPWKKQSSSGRTCLLDDPRSLVDLEQVATALDWSEECMVWQSLLPSSQFAATASLPQEAAFPVTATEELSPPTKRTTRGKSKRAGSKNRVTNQDAAAPVATSAASSSLATTMTTTTNRWEESSVWTRFWNQANQVELDGRLSSKRWSSVALVWFLPGQVRLLEMALEILECQQSIQANESASSSSSSIALVLALVARLIRMVQEVGAACGNRPASNCGVETYVTSVLGGGKPSKPKKSSKSISSSSNSSNSNNGSGSPGGRPDLREIATVLISKLIDRHQDCLLAASKQDAATTAMLNECIPTIDALPFRPALFPFLRDVLEELARATSASVSSLYSEQSACTDRLLYFAAAWIFKRQVEQQQRDGYIVLDVRLTNMAVTKLKRCLASCLSAIVGACVSSTSSASQELTPPAGLTATSTMAGSNAALHREMERSFLLHEPLPIPILTASVTPALVSSSSATPGKRARKSKKTSIGSGSSSTTTGAVGAKSFCSYAGIFAESTTSATSTFTSPTLSNTSGIINDVNKNAELLALFFRAMLSSNHERTMTSSMDAADTLVSHLIGIVEQCYSVSSIPGAATGSIATAVEAKPTPSKGRKRGAAETTTRRKKKRKLDDEAIREEIGAEGVTR